MANKIHAYIHNIKNIAHAMFTIDLLGGKNEENYASAGSQHGAGKDRTILVILVLKIMKQSKILTKFSIEFSKPFL